MYKKHISEPHCSNGEWLQLTWAGVYFESFGWEKPKSGACRYVIPTTEVLLSKALNPKLCVGLSINRMYKQTGRKLESTKRWTDALLILGFHGICWQQAKYKISPTLSFKYVYGVEEFRNSEMLVQTQHAILPLIMLIWTILCSSFIVRLLSVDPSRPIAENSFWNSAWL